MRSSWLGLAAAGLLASVAPSLALAQDGAAANTQTTQTTVVKEKGGQGAGVGVAGGAVAGALVGGPVGAVVGAVAGGAAGAAIDPPREVKTYVTTQEVRPVSYNGPVAVGDTLPDTVTVYDVPSDQRYVWTNINGQRLLLDRRSHKIVAVVNP
jgi:hypothetical protein